jgi:hypothetical protein
MSGRRKPAPATSADIEVILFMIAHHPTSRVRYNTIRCDRRDADLMWEILRVRHRLRSGLSA